MLSSTLSDSRNVHVTYESDFIICMCNVCVCVCVFACIFTPLISNAISITYVTAVTWLNTF